LKSAGCVGYLVSIAVREVVHDRRTSDSRAEFFSGSEVMLRSKQAIVVVCFAASLWLIAGYGVAIAQSLPASGRYQCNGASGAMPERNFTVGPGNIYTSARGWRDTVTVHPLSGNILFHGTTPQHAYQGHYESGPPPQVALLTVTDGATSETGIACQMR
jgi:hypothetical protein